MALGSGGYDETGWKPGLLMFSSPLIFPHRMTFYAERRGPKEIKSQTRTALETITHCTCVAFKDCFPR